MRYIALSKILLNSVQKSSKKQTCCKIIAK